MYQLPKGAIPIIKKIKKKEVLIEIKKKFNNEVGTIIRLISKHNSENPGVIGFWAELRLLFPIIETISKICNITVEDLIKNEFNIKTPNLFWNAFRNSLTHNDWIYTQKLGIKTVSWGVTLDEEHHFINGRDLIIDPSALYKDIDKYLDTKIKETKVSEKVEIDFGIEYLKNGLLTKKGKIIKPKIEIIKEFKLLNYNYDQK